jgi:hypothetical protein
LGEKESSKKEVSAAQAATMDMDCTDSAGDNTDGKQYRLSPSWGDLAGWFHILPLPYFNLCHYHSCYTIVVYAQAPEPDNAAVGRYYRAAASTPQAGDSPFGYI